MKKFLSQPRPYTQNPVVAGHTGRNASLIADAARLYIPDGAHVLDMTYGAGAFWASTDTSRFHLHANDSKFTEKDLAELTVSLPTGYFTLAYSEDFRQMHFASSCIDVAVFDPPYKSGGFSSHPAMVEQYGLDAIKTNTPSQHGNKGFLVDLYVDGMTEAHRMLTTSGLLFAKTQDFVESGKQNWFHVEVKEMAERLGFATKDLFVLVTDRRPMMRHKTQHHARKNVSYLWVFQKAG